MEIIYYLVLFILPVLGGIQIFLFRKSDDKYIRLLLSFSGAYLFGLTILHLMPMIFEFDLYLPGVYIIIGFLIQIILDQLSKGVEHGHMHIDEKVSGTVVFSIMIGLGIHAFLEGIPLGGLDAGNEIHSHGEDGAGMENIGLVPLLLGIAIHKIPAAFALMAIFISAKMPIRKAIGLLLVFAAITPFAALMTTWFTSMDIAITGSVLMAIMAIVLGSFLHISTTILFEVESKLHRFSLVRILTIILGLGMAYLTII